MNRTLLFPLVVLSLAWALLCSCSRAVKETPRRPASAQSNLLGECVTGLLGNDFEKARSTCRAAGKVHEEGELASLGWLYSAMANSLLGAMQEAQRDYLEAASASPGSPIALVALYALEELVPAVSAEENLADALEEMLRDANSTTVEGALFRLRLRRLIDTVLPYTGKRPPPRNCFWEEAAFVPRHPAIALEEEAVSGIEDRPDKGLPVSCHDGVITIDGGKRVGLLRLRTIVQAAPEGKTHKFLLEASGDFPWRLRVGGGRLENRPDRFFYSRPVRAVVELGPVPVELELEATVDGEKKHLAISLEPISPDSSLKWHMPQKNGRKSVRTGHGNAALEEVGDPLLNRASLTSLPANVMLALSEGKTDEARYDLEQLREKHPESCLLEFLSGQAVLEDFAVPWPVDIGTAAGHFRSCSNRCTSAKLCDFRLAVLEAENGRPLDAFKRLKRTTLTGFPAAEVFKARLLNSLGLSELAISSVRKVLSKHPHHLQALSLGFELYKDKGRLGEAADLAVRLAKAGDYRALLEVVKLEPSIAPLLRRELEMHPYEPGLWLEGGFAALERGSPSESLRMINRATELAPYNSQVLQRAANLLEAGGWSKEALAARRLLARQFPWDVRYRLALPLAENAKGPSIPGQQFLLDASDVLNRYRNEDWSPDGQAVVVLDDVYFEALDGGGTLTRVHQVVHVKTPQAAEEWGEFDMPPEGAVLLRLDTIKADGSRFEGSAAEEKDSISLHALEAGDFIEMDMLLASREGDLPLATPVWLSPLRSLGGVDRPVFEWQTTISLPPGSRWRIAPSGSLARFAPGRSGKRIILQARAKRLAPVPDEPFSPPQSEIVPSFVVDTGASWKSVLWVLSAQFGWATVPDLLVEKWVRDRCAGLGKKDCARKLFHWVCSAITQEGPDDDLSAPGLHVLAERRGNRLVALATLLRAAGLEPHFFLARPNDSGVPPHGIPRPDLFSTGLLSVEIDGNTHWMVPDGRFRPFGWLPPELWGSRALQVWPRDGKALDVLEIQAPRKANLPWRKISLRLVLGTDGLVRGKVVERASPANASEYRSAMADLGKEDRKKRLEFLLGKLVAGARMGELEIRNLFDADEDLVLRYSFESAELVRRVGESLFFLPLMQHHIGRNLPVTLPRRHAIVIPNPFTVETSIEVELPAGWRCLTMADESIEVQPARFDYRVDCSGGKLYMNRTLVIGSGRIRPADAERFKRLLDRVDSLEARPIELVPSAGPGEHQ